VSIIPLVDTIIEPHQRTIAVHQPPPDGPHRRETHFLTFERWKDKAALDAHMVTPDMKAIAPMLGPVLAKPFTQLFLDARTGG
jgi:quinol monooxygenase YgiN